MIALQIRHIKDFMNKLLIQDTFDRFLVSEASVTTFATFTVDGNFIRTSTPRRKPRACALRDGARCCGKKSNPSVFPLSAETYSPLFQICLSASQEEVSLLTAKSSPDLSAEDVFGLYLNCQYNGETLTLTTGSSLRLFTMDKSLDQAWDKMLMEFLRLQDLD